jgi:hypothetical protein
MSADGNIMFLAILIILHEYKRIPLLIVLDFYGFQYFLLLLLVTVAFAEEQNKAKQAQQVNWDHFYVCYV